MLSQSGLRILVFNENPLPARFTNLTIAGKELRLRAALDQVAEIHVITRTGQSLQMPGQPKVTDLEEKIKIHRLMCPYYLAPVGLALAGLVWWLRYRQVPDVIEAESPVLSGMPALLWGRLWRKPVILEVRSSFDKLVAYKFGWLPGVIKDWFWQKFYPWLIRSADLVIANSQFYRQQSLRQGAKQVVEVNPGLQFLPDDFQAVKPDVIDHPRQVVVGFLGRLAPEKGPQLVISAFAQVVKKLPDYQLKLVIGGQGKLWQELKAKTKQLGLESQVQFAGWVNNWQFLSQVDLLINATLVSPPLEMVNVEAAKTGVPVIALSDQGLPETVQDNVSGIKVAQVPDQAELVARLSQALVRMITHPKQIMRLGRQAKTWAEKNYSFEQQVERVRQAYCQLSII